MYIKNNILNVVFRVVFLILCGTGIVIKLLSFGISADIIFGDFALTSNALALIYFAYLIIARPGYERGMLRGAVTIYMIVTFVVYYFVSFGGSVDVNQLSTAGYLLYFISPIMVFADYLLFCRKGEFTAYSPILWMIIPVVFNIVVYFINRLGFSVDMLSYFNLPGINMIITMLTFLGISYLLFVIDGIFAGRKN